MSTKTIINCNLSMFCVELQEAILGGFRLSYDSPAHMWGAAYEATLEKDDTQQAFVGVVEEFKEGVSVV